MSGQRADAVVLATAGDANKPSWAANHGAALAACATTLVLLLVSAAFLPRKALEAPPSPPAHWFDDGGRMVSSGFAGGKSEYLQQYLPLVLHASVLVVTLPRAPRGAIEEYTARAANAWKIGGNGTDNGVVLFVFRDDRTFRLEIGYGLEGVLPDIAAKRLVDSTLLPKFAAGLYEEGFDDFLFALQDELKDYSAQTERSRNNTGVIEYAWAVLKHSPRALRSAWAIFVQGDANSRIVLALFAAVFAALFGYALTGLARGLFALVQIPWKIATGTAVHALNRQELAAEFAPAEFVRRPPPSLAAVAAELNLGTVFWGGLCLAGIVIGLAFVGLGTEIFIGERGQFSGAGVTAVWPNR